MKKLWLFLMLAVPCCAEKKPETATVPASVNHTGTMLQRSFLSACANFAFFQQIEGRKPTEEA